MNKFFGICFALFLIQACSPGISTDAYRAPYGSIIQDTIINKEISTPTEVGTRTGEACAVGYFGIVATGDASVKAAAAAGGIAKVKAVDYRLDTLLGSVIAQTCTIVHGD